MSKKTDSGIGGAIAGFFLLIFLFGWLTIPTSEETYTGFDVASLTFANGIFSGWADDVAIKLFHSSTQYEEDNARNAFREVILMGETNFPTTTTIFNLLGAFASIGGVIAVWIARTASGPGEAFKLGFGAEIAESIAFHLGYYTTVGQSAVSPPEILITLFVALVMGGVAASINKK